MSREHAFRSKGSRQHSFQNSASSSLKGETHGMKSLVPFLGPAFIAAVAYIDPGNYATNIAAGSRYGYTLLWVILASNLMAVLIQTMSAKLGIATGKNLPEVCRDRFSKKTSFFLWIQAELVVMATDLAEFIGAALGLYLIFNIPMVTAALIAAVGSFAILELQRRGVRPLEAIITGMVFIVVIAFGVQVFYAQPEAGPMLTGLFTPRFEGIDSVLLSAGMLGATVMPHAIYLHSALTQKRIVGTNETEKRKIFKFELVDVIIAMVIAGAINASMLIVSAALFNKEGLFVEDLDVAFHQFDHLLGSTAAVMFGVGLLSAGLSSSSVGTLSGDVIMQGFIKRRIPIYLRRFITMVPPLAIIIMGVNPSKALVMSQIVLSFGIAFALVPLIMFTSDKNLMKSLVNRKITTIIAWIIAVIIIVLNVFLLYQTLFR
ncbi:Nramp family divalent metal transporter [Pseudalkalibacillus caeni]|uniref:Divalent metal cation transporter MntH n=1 Tax=Exobacillus caeni TaxID=2574798 RepID=A0A5R9F8K9_9BACL|nr:Nramp family divalent metal transporter [Pseudalkalibacillus caeni]TLS37183.1 divalent metal cation transporter [Pseudalkalibacillus caeni]